MRKLLALAFGVVLLSGPSVLWSATYQTTLAFETPVTNPGGIDNVSFLWTTSNTSGPVSRADITDLTMILSAGATPLYTDIVLAGGVLQPIGGVARVLDDIVWDFDLDSLLLSQIRNAQPSQMGTSTGLQITVEDNVDLQTDSQLGLTFFVEGVQAAATIDLVASQTTQIVPEPGTAGAVVLAIGSVMIWRRKRAR